MRRGAAWESLQPEVESQNISLGTGFAPQATGLNIVEKIGSMVVLSISAEGTFTSGTYQTVASVPVDWAPKSTVRGGAMGSGMRGYCGIQVSRNTGSVELGWANGGGGLSAPAWIQGQLTWFI